MRRRVVDSLEELADTEFQERVWWREDGPEVSSFIECIEGLFSDSGLKRRLDIGEPVFSPDIDLQLVHLCELGSRIDPYRPHEIVKADPNLQQAKLLAQSILHALIVA